MQIRFRIDRDIAVPVTAQLRGQLEYGVAFGEILPGEALPSVRDLADRLGIAPVTVAQVYRELQDKGLLETRVGRGTFVRSDAPRPEHPDQASYGLDGLVVRMLRVAHELSLSTDELAHMVALRVARLQDERPLRLLVVGNFPRATRRYAREVQRYLPPDDHVEWTVLDALRSSADAEGPPKGLSAALTPAYRAAAVRRAIGPATPVLKLPFSPSTGTRMRLAALSPLDRVALVSADADYLLTFRRDVRRFAPHVEIQAATFLNDPDLGEGLEACDVLIHATGADAAVDAAPATARVFEFRFEPHPRALVQDVLPSLHALRSTSDPQRQESSS